MVVFTNADLKIGLSHRLSITGVITNLFLYEDIADNSVNIDFLADDGGNHPKIIDELLEVLSRLAFRKDVMQSMEVVLKLGFHHCQGNSVSVMNPMTGDLLNMIGDVL